MSIRVTIWNEFVHEKKHADVAAIYPQGIHTAIADGIGKLEPSFAIHTATLEEPEHGLSEEMLNETDVLIWWSHARNNEVEDHIVERVCQRIYDGMGFIALHSTLNSKIFRKLMGTTCRIKWREADDKERIWVVDPSHPIAEGIGSYIEVGQEEMYGEHFDIPIPDELVFVSWFTGGEVFRSGVTYRRGRGKIFYFRPGHQEFPTYHHPDILRVIANAVQWAAPRHGARPTYGNASPLS